MNPGELTHIVKLQHIAAAPYVIEPSQKELCALALRFDISAVRQLKAEISLFANGAAVTAKGQIQAKITQQCAVSGEDFPVSIEEQIHFRFVPQTSAPELEELEELELNSEDCDDIFYAGESFDLGEAVSQSLGLAIDFFAKGPNADAARETAGMLDESAAGPFAALAALKNDQIKK